MGLYGKYEVHVFYVSGRDEWIFCTQYYRHNGWVYFERNHKITHQIPTTSIEKMETR